MVPKERRMNWECGISRCKLLYTEQINNKVLLYSTGNSTQYLEIIYNGKESEKEHIYIYSGCSVAKSCLTLCNAMNCSMQGFPVLHYLLEFAQTPIHWISDVIQPSHFLQPLLLLPSIFSIIGSFPVNQLFPSGDQSIGASASASVLPMNIQG